MSYKRIPVEAQMGPCEVCGSQRAHWECPKCGYKWNDRQLSIDKSRDIDCKCGERLLLLPEGEQ